MPPLRDWIIVVLSVPEIGSTFPEATGVQKTTGQVVEPGRRVSTVSIALATAAGARGHGVLALTPRVFAQGLEIESEGPL